jgi:hypothetical protein
LRERGAPRAAGDNPARGGIVRDAPKGVNDKSRAGAFGCGSEFRKATAVLADLAMRDKWIFLTKANALPPLEVIGAFEYDGPIRPINSSERLLRSRHVIAYEGGLAE